ncbi:MAG: BlaI/MecI/CopY family transcriptional regulator [Gemmatimonadota bacterium]|jgi:BlaI family transcriptional regulator, penicillinase repressor
MEVTPNPHLSRRERQIMDVVYRLGAVTVSDVLNELPEAPGYSAVRAMLRKLEEKGHLKHAVDGPRYVYTATRPRDEVGESAMRRLIRTFFDGSASRTVAAILDAHAADLTPDELETLGRMIEQARRRGR